MYSPSLSNLDIAGESRMTPDQQMMPDHRMTPNHRMTPDLRVTPSELRMAPSELRMTPSELSLQPDQSHQEIMMNSDMRLNPELGMTSDLNQLRLGHITESQVWIGDLHVYCKCRIVIAISIQSLTLYMVLGIFQIPLYGRDYKISHPHVSLFCETL